MPRITELTIRLLVALKETRSKIPYDIQVLTTWETVSYGVVPEKVVKSEGAMMVVSR